MPRNSIYTPLWEALKQHRAVKVKYRRSLLPRLRRALTQVKYFDEEWRAEAAYLCGSNHSGSKSWIKYIDLGEEYILIVLNVADVMNPAHYNFDGSALADSAFDFGELHEQ